MRDSQEFHVVTGAFGFTGRYITQQLLKAGKRVRTITGHPARANCFGNHIEIAPLDFENPANLVRSLQGASVLYNTYWIRFNHGEVTFEQAAKNSQTLICAAREAHVRKIVHVSIANPSLDSDLPYYSGKARVEEALIKSGLSYAILRPTVIFGLEDILINNIAWLARHFPVFAIPGTGQYQIQPIYVEDFADLALRAAENDENLATDAVGAETFAFKDLVALIAKAVRSSPKLIHVSPWAALQMLRFVEPFVGDVILTKEEIEGLMANLLVSTNAPTGQTRFSAWLAENANTLGRAYASELQRHYR